MLSPFSILTVYLQRKREKYSQKQDVVAHSVLTVWVLQNQYSVLALYMRDRHPHHRSRAPVWPSDALTLSLFSVLWELQPASEVQIVFEDSLVTPAWSKRSFVDGTLSCQPAHTDSHPPQQNAPPPRRQSSSSANQGQWLPNCAQSYSATVTISLVPPVSRAST